MINRGYDSPSTSKSLILSLTRFKRLGILLVILGSAGYMIENVIWLRFPGVFNFGLSYLVSVLSVLIYFLVYGLRLRDQSTLKVWLVLLFLDLTRAFFRWLSGEFIFNEWVASFGLFLFSFTVFMITSGYTVTRQDLKALLPAFVAICMGFSLFTIVQFLVGNVRGVLIHLPYEWLNDITVNYTNFQQRMNSYGVFRAFGIAAEPSYQGIALATLLALTIFFEKIKLFSKPHKFQMTLITLFIGIFTTFSLGGWFMSAVLLIPFIIKRPKYLISTILFGVLLGFCLVIYPTTRNIIEPATNRVKLVFNQQDKSTQSRVFSSLEMLLFPPRDIVDALFGTGLGLQRMNSSLASLDVKYGKAGSVYQPNNTLAKIKVTQGLTGLLAFLGVAFVVFKPFKSGFPLFYPLLIAWIARLFVSGSYLVPTIWCFMALVVMLRRDGYLITPK